MINSYISELIAYGINKGLVDSLDKVCVTNRVLEILGLYEYQEENPKEIREIHLILNDILNYAIDKGLVEDTTINKDLFDTKIMSALTPNPSVVINKFYSLFEENKKAATDYYYDLSQATNYIRVDRIRKDEKWSTETEYGLIDITINLSKPEKDPKDIARAGQMKKSGYPSCLLCRENEGYSGHFNHPARQNHRIIPIKLDGIDYFIQYSPYSYYNEHCILLNKEHTPMRIDLAVFRKLLDFVRQFPHYMAGSNADLPIVGGSILAHDHFQGGSYEFAMERAPIREKFTLKDYPNVKAGIVNWPLSVIRLNGTDLDQIASCADHILTTWREYTDEAAFIFSHTGDTPHNTITPIARVKNGELELDLVLRNNITTDDAPWGVYHPSADLHHIKKENIGLIEVMGLAVLPARLKQELNTLEEYILEGKDITSCETIIKHNDWVLSWINNYTITKDNCKEIIRNEVSKVFVKVLECAGVYKNTNEGKAAFQRFIDSIK